MRVILIYGWWTLASVLWATLGRAQMPDPPGQVGPGETPQYEAYLFAHIKHGDYGRLYLYYEQYPGVAYGLSVAAHLQGPWFQAAGNQRPDWDKYHLPARVRHGSMLPITRKQYDALVVAFDEGSTEQ